MNIKNIIVVATLCLFYVKGRAERHDDQGRRGHGQPPAEVIEALNACALENNITLAFDEKQKPSEEQRAIIDACMKTKGFTPPAPRGKSGCRSDESNQVSESEEQ